MFSEISCGSSAMKSTYRSQIETILDTAVGSLMPTSFSSIANFLNNPLSQLDVKLMYICAYSFRFTSFTSFMMLSSVGSTKYTTGISVIHPRSWLLMLLCDVIPVFFSSTPNLSSGAIICIPFLS